MFDFHAFIILAANAFVFSIVVVGIWEGRR